MVHINASTNMASFQQLETQLNQGYPCGLSRFFNIMYRISTLTHVTIHVMGFFAWKNVLARLKVSENHGVIFLRELEDEIKQFPQIRKT